MRIEVVKRRKEKRYLLFVYTYVRVRTQRRERHEIDLIYV